MNRTLRWTKDGLEYEPDQRHAELIVKDVSMERARAVATPGTAETREETQHYAKCFEMGRSESTSYRGLAARLNYLALDRPELQFAAQNVPEKMAAPREADSAKLKRVPRYVLRAPRLVQTFLWQQRRTRLHTYTDSD